MKHSKLFQLLFDIRISNKSFFLPKVRGIAYRLYQLLLKRVAINNYYIKSTIGNNEIYLPIYHQLGWTINTNTLYSKNLSRINKYISTFFKEYTIIDIGANIGDSAFILREGDADNQIICVEGNDEYLPLLRENLSHLKNISLVESFVGESENIHGEVVSDGKGTSTIVKNANGAIITYLPLHEIINGYSSKKNPRLIKIDTDGYDCAIIKSSIAKIKKYKSVIFFEYVPNAFPNGIHEHDDIFQVLVENDYHYFIFYDGTGNYIISSTRNEIALIAKEMHFYFTSGYKSYGDVAVFHESNEALFEYAVKEEKLFYKNHFKN